MNFEHGIELFVSHLVKHTIPGIAGVVYDDVNAVVFRKSLRDKLLRKVGVGYIAANLNGGYP